MTRYKFGVKIFFPNFRNSESGFLIELVSIPKAQDEIVSVVKRAKRSFISIGSSTFLHCSRWVWRASPHWTIIGNIIFIFPELKVGLSFALKFLHLLPPMWKRCPEIRFSVKKQPNISNMLSLFKRTYPSAVLCLRRTRYLCRGNDWSPLLICFWWFRGPLPEWQVSQTSTNPESFLFCYLNVV